MIFFISFFHIIVLYFKDFGSKDPWDEISQPNQFISCLQNANTVEEFNWVLQRMLENVIIIFIEQTQKMCPEFDFIWLNKSGFCHLVQTQ